MSPRGAGVLALAGGRGQAFPAEGLLCPSSVGHPLTPSTHLSVDIPFLTYFALSCGMLFLEVLTENSYTLSLGRQNLRIQILITVFYVFFIKVNVTWTVSS